MEGLILRFYLKVFSLVLIPLFYLIYLFLIRDIVFKSEYFVINKQASYQEIINDNIADTYINLFFFKSTLRFVLINDIKIHHGKFKLNNNISFLKLIKTITSPSNIYEKITIVEGWTKYKLNDVLESNFKKFKELEYSEIIADTYFFSKNSAFLDFEKKLKHKYDKIKNSYKNQELLKIFSFKEI